MFVRIARICFLNKYALFDFEPWKQFFMPPKRNIFDFEIYAFAEIRKTKSGKYKSETNRSKAIGITTGDTSILEN